MGKQGISTTTGAQPVGAYSQGLRAGDFVFVSGQGPLDPKPTRTTVGSQLPGILVEIDAIAYPGKR
jgi:2-iminobutanoate/2-iminopropanoate deaminase